MLVHCGSRVAKSAAGCRGGMASVARAGLQRGPCRGPLTLPPPLFHIPPPATSFFLSLSLLAPPLSLVLSLSLLAPPPSPEDLPMAQQRVGPGPNKRMLDLPLILCTECKLRRVVRRVSTQEHSLGQVFYCCPLHRRNSGCPFFYWEDDYEKYLQFLARKGKLAALLADVGEHSNAGPKVEVEECEMKEFVLHKAGEEAMVKQFGIVGGTPSGEVVETLKALFFVCVVC